MDEIELNGKKYVEKDSIQTKREEIKNKEFVMARTYSAGVFAGYLKSRKGKEIVLQDAIRIYSWSGAASLSELAKRGSSKPNDCRFPVTVDEVLLTELIELIPITAIAEKNIKAIAGKWTK